MKVCDRCGIDMPSGGESAYCVDCREITGEDQRRIDARKERNRQKSRLYYSRHRLRVLHAQMQKRERRRAG